MTMRTIESVLGTIAYEDVGDAAGPVALLWPSLFSDHTMWAGQADALHAAGWRTLALDPPGHGGSPGPGRTFTVDECAEVAGQLLATIPADVPAVMMGTSWGGMVAPRVARRHPRRLVGIVLFNTTADRPNLYARLTSRLLTIMLAIPALDRTVDDMLLSLQLGAETRRLRPELGERLMARFRTWERRPMIRSVASVLIARDAFVDQLAGVDTPALVVSGREDTLLPTALSLRIADRMPNARHVEVEGAAHLVPVERPDAANALILDFLSKLEVAR